MKTEKILVSLNTLKTPHFHVLNTKTKLDIPMLNYKLFTSATLHVDSYYIFNFFCWLDKVITVLWMHICVTKYMVLVE